MNSHFASKALILFILFAATSATAQPRIPAQSGAGKRQIIPGRFIVTLTVEADPNRVAQENGVAPEHVYRNVIKGFGGTIAEAARAGLLRDKRVLRIEPDVVVTADAVGWGQDRIDQRRLPLDNIYKKNYTGQGVTAYIVDGGINYQHTEFGGRASFGYDVYGGNGSDCAGHGTHVAGTVGGATYGVAPAVSLVSVRVMDCNGSGTMSGVIAGLDWIAANLRRPAVVNLSLGGPATQAMDDAVVRLMNAGALVVAAAGNENVDACNTSPARAPDIITVGATDQNDARASFSNYGACLDLFAPGVMIPAAWYSSTTTLAYMDGTSSATPAVAGAAALMLQHYPSISARALRDSILNHSTKGVVTGSLSAKNHLLYSLEANDGVLATPTPTPTPVNTPPVAAFTQNCTSLSCAFADRSTDGDGSIVAWRWEFGNGATSTLQNPSVSYAVAGTYTVRLTVTDNNGATASTSAPVTVLAPVAANLAPVARFGGSCTQLACTFQDQSYDNDGSIVSWRWEFGNGVTSTTRNPSYTYPAAGTYTVRLTVTDNAGATGTAASAVTVTSPPVSSNISLSVSVGKHRGNYNTTLRWSGATTSTVDINRNNVKIRTVANTGSYTETLPRGSYTYRVCNAGSSTCSVDRAISF